MGQLSHLVLLASIVASCISYSIDSTKTMSVPVPPEEPSESEFSEIPIEFMNNLIASLTPEKLKELLEPKELGEPSLVDRNGNTYTSPCSSDNDIKYYNFVKATDGEVYYVINSLEIKLQPIIHYACNKTGSNDNKCDPGNNDKDYGYCCRQHMANVEMMVLPIPKSRLYRQNQNFIRKDTNEIYIYKKDTMIPKNVSLTSYCSCDQSMMSIKSHYTCPNPESKFFI